MTNSELIKKICKYAGINETEDQLFFDSFAKRLILEFKPGDVLKLGNIGFLHLKNIRSSESGVQVKGLVFSENLKIAKGNNVFLISHDKDIFHPIDFCFSPSLRKMEIPLSNEITSGIFIPPSGNELLSFIDSKVENLFNKIEVNKDNLHDEVFVIPVEIPGMKVIEHLEDISSFKSVSKDEEQKIDPDKFQKIDSITSGFKEDIHGKSSEKKIFKSKSINVAKEEKDGSKTTEGYEKIRYNRINSLISSGKPKPEEKKEKLTNESEIRHEKEPASEQEKEKIGAPVKKEEKPEFLESGVKELAKRKELEKKRRVAEETEYFRQRDIKRKSKAKFFIPLAVIIILGFLIYFLRLYNFKTSESDERIRLLPASNPVEIAGTYDIPVDYPYKPNNRRSLLFDGIDSSVYKEKQDNAAVAVQKPINEDDIPTVNQGAYKEFAHYIFKDGNSYFIQVSSWKYKSSAVNHLKRLIKEGYHASVERVVSPSGEVYYRVRLGNFQSLEEANEFVQNN